MGETRYGYCQGSDEWISGTLFGPCPDHPGQYMGIAGHISSSVGWSEHDIRVFHHEKIGDGAEFVWLGHFTNGDDLRAALPVTLCTNAEHAALAPQDGE